MMDYEGIVRFADRRAAPRAHGAGALSVVSATPSAGGVQQQQQQQQQAQRPAAAPAPAQQFGGGASYPVSMGMQ
ncbi:hypothetical protein ACFOWB_23755 [Chenggangzhangella methanolivorans]|uniref:hypothetical protein n=1 Tax=Chenggangzhangella methanolivorans TaxID=1437009 RepID=UPI00360FD6D5